MSLPSGTESTTEIGSTSKKLVVLLSTIFFLSGFASLIYQVVWQRLLTVHYGVGMISIAIIVSVYMFGLGIGALLGGALAERVKNRILLYFVVEMLIGCFGLLSIPFLELLGRHTAGANYLASFSYMFLFLSLPTSLMGITLPLLVKIYNQFARDFLRTVSFLYFVNTIGAAAGALFSAYAIISFLGLDAAIYFAVAINFMLAGMIFVSAYMPPVPESRIQRREAEPLQEAILGTKAYLLVFLTGFLAIGYEIIWFRVVGVLLKASPYVFSTVLSIYLLGISIGSFGMGGLLRVRNDIPRKSLFFFVQFLVGISVFAIFLGYYYLNEHTSFGALTKASFRTDLHPSFSNPFMGSFWKLCFSLDFWKLFVSLDVLFWPIFFVFIPTILMGANFPLISFLAQSRLGREGQTVGYVYFSNTLGNVMGGIVTGFWLLPQLGTELTTLVFSSINISMLLFVRRRAGTLLSWIFRSVFVIAFLLTVMILFPQKGRLYRTMHGNRGQECETYFEEGIDGVIMTYKRNGTIANYINGLSHGGRPNAKFAMETIEALSCSPDARKVLLVGYGTGTIAEIVLKRKDIEDVTIVELNKTLMSNLNKIPLFERMLSDKRIRLIFDDGRRYLLRTDEKFDLILMDPLRTTTAYSNNIYSREFFNLVRKSLKDDGILMAWTDEQAVVPKTVASVFDSVRMYRLAGQSYFVIASKSSITSDAVLREEMIADLSPSMRPQISVIARNMRSVETRQDILRRTDGFPINEDKNPACEYYLGLRFRKRRFLQ